MAPEELILRLSAMRDTRETGKIYLRADRALDYGRVMQVMGALNRAGFRDIGLVTDQADPAAAGRLRPAWNGRRCGRGRRFRARCMAG